MDTYFFRKETPIVDEVEVLVVGAGPSGFPAAIAAARNGAKTLLIERFGCVGGMATTGLVGPFMTSFDAQGRTQIVRGIFDELIRRLEEKGGAIHPSKVRGGSTYSSFIIDGHDHVTPFDPEWMKIISADMVLESGARLLLHTQFLDVMKEENRVVGVIVANKGGIQAIRAKVIIDCTGDADLAFQAGVPFTLGNEKNHKMMPTTMFFRVGNVDTQRLIDAYLGSENPHRDLMGKPKGGFSWIVSEARRKGEWELGRNKLGMYETPTSGEWRINTTRIADVDGTNPKDLTKAEIEGRKQARTVFEFLKKNIVGYEKAQFMDTGAVIGIRETRHIVGEYVISIDDVLNGRLFEDMVLLASNAVDIHAEQGEVDNYQTMYRGSYYSIPYRSLVPLKVENLLVAGRPISATSEASSAFRVMTCCVGMGEAAGTAATLAIQSNQSPRNIDVKKLQAQLRAQGVYLG